MNETFYDDEIAPKLAELAELCHARGMSFVSGVEFEPGRLGSTLMLMDAVSMLARLPALALRCDGNVDALFFAIIKHAQKHGHSSICLAQLGVPLTPEKPVMQ